MAPKSTDIETQLNETLSNFPWADYSFIPLDTPSSFPKLQNWINNGRHGEMTYMEKSLEVRKNPKKFFPPMQSLILFRFPYFPHPQGDDFPLQNLKTAHYANGRDYHLWFRDKLNEVIIQLKNQFSQETFLAFTDSVPLLERDHAYQAGLGWVGKNTCLIDRKKGSLFFIGEVLTSLPLKNQSSQVPDHCGTCTRCIDECPTEAIDQRRGLDATRCIAYWNIESRKVPPVDIREKMGGWFFGCDICQTVCPWNIKLHKLNPTFDNNNFHPNEDTLEELRFILSHSNKQLQKLFKDTPLSRAGGRGLKRNALVCIGNEKLTPLSDIVHTYREDPQLGELAQWTLEQLS